VRKLQESSKFEEAEAAEGKNECVEFKKREKNHQMASTLWAQNARSTGKFQSPLRRFAQRLNQMGRTDGSVEQRIEFSLEMARKIIWEDHMRRGLKTGWCSKEARVEEQRKASKRRKRESPFADDLHQAALV